MGFPLFPISKLDSEQVLKHAYDDALQRLRVDAAISPSGGATEVIISHADDSIRIGDGIKLVTATTVGSSVGLDVNVLNTADGLGVTPTIVNISMPISGNEYSFNIPLNTKFIFFKSRKNGKLQYAYISGNTGTTYRSVSPGVLQQIYNIKTISGNTMYIQSTKNNDVLEIEYWI